MNSRVPSEVYYQNSSNENNGASTQRVKSASTLANDFRARAAKIISARPKELTLTTGQHIYWFENYLGLSRQDAIFNEAVTNSALDSLINSETSPPDLLEVGSKIIEQTNFNFFSSITRQSTKNLALAKKFGTFYTPLNVAMRMAKELLEKKTSYTLIEPCSGSGILSGAVLLSQASLKKGYREFILIEKDGCTLAWSHRLLTALIERLNCSDSVKLNFLQGDAAIRLLRQSQGEEAGADVIMNPPYGRIRFTKDAIDNGETRAATAAAALKLRTDFDREDAATRNLFSHLGAGAGVPEYSKIFSTLAARCALRGNSVVLIGPDSWLAGKDGTALRRLVLENKLLNALHLYPESSRLFETVNQATAIVSFDNQPKTKITISRHNGDTSKILYKQATALIPVGIPLMAADSVEAKLLEKLDNFTKLGSLPYVKNLRGEVDQTKFSQSLSVQPTKFRLIRGEHVDRFTLRHFSSNKKPGYLEESATERIGPKLADAQQWRLIGRQCSYAKQARRLIFTLIAPGCVAGNSCNYISLPGGKKRDFWAWLGLLNSGVLDWFFRARNSNNHVANYEIDNLPTPPWTSKQIDEIAELSRRLSRASENENSSQVELLEGLLEAYVCCLFGLSDEETSLVLKSRFGESFSRVLNFSRKISSGFNIPLSKDSNFFNHDLPRLSELDMEMIRSVPEGGNWQNIPETVPSARLAQIREMSRMRGVVRTTYYGRLRKDQPSYTISTYFNRPGNGTHIHPREDRTLTCREAARLQSFPDSYIFFGPEGAVRKQIGNAVPPLLARAIGASLRGLTEHRTTVDVFCGAGGMSIGLEAAGWESTAAIDIDESALQTYAFNRPSSYNEAPVVPRTTLVLRKDLQDSVELKTAIRSIKSRLDGRRLGLLAGGPPCQGFSHAGFRAADDSRNDLAVAYLKLAQELKPEVFLLENVEGLLTFQGGRVAAEIVRTLQELGYETAPIWRLAAEEYGVPQMRRRVFIIGTRSCRPPTPPRATHSICPGRWKNKAINRDLPAPITVEEAFSGLSLPVLDITPGDFAQWINSYDSSSQAS